VIDSFRNIFAIPDLRKRVFFTFALLAVYRLGAYIPIPGIDPVAIAEFTKAAEGTVLGFLNLFSGGALGRMTVFALGIMPYISASIILQLLTVVWPYLEKLSKEGELGRRKITQYTRYGTVVLSVIQGMGISFFLERTTAPGGAPLVPEHFQGWGFRLLTVLTLTTGTAFVMWLGEQISERGIGNGISLIIFAGIVFQYHHRRPDRDAEYHHRHPAGRLHGHSGRCNRLHGAGATANTNSIRQARGGAACLWRPEHIPAAAHQYRRRDPGDLRGLDHVLLPQTLGQMIENRWLQKITEALAWGEPMYNLVYFLSIIFFCYFYTSIIFNPEDTAENMRKYGGFIPGIRPGKRTAEFIDKILTRITLVGAVYLALVAILPEILIAGFKVATIPFIGPTLDSLLPAWFTQGLGVKFFFGGTSLLIVVGVAMDTVNQIESQLVMRHYDGFMRKGRVRGRRG